MTRQAFLSRCAILGLALVAACLVSLNSGVMKLPLSESLHSIGSAWFGSGVSELPDHQRAVLMELRLPRTLLAVLVGAMLAQSGAAMQGMFRNPLADPGIIGVSAGAAAGAVLAIYLSPPDMTWWSVPICAFAGGFGCSLLIYRLAQASLGTSVLVLLLAGVAISAIAGALIGLISYVSDDARLRDLTLWQMGSLGAADNTRVWLALVAALAIGIRFQYRASALNALLLGESEARNLGINVENLKRELVILVALAVGLAVACAGMIGFIGLVVPHIVRTLCGPDHRTLLPMAALGGGLLLLFADVVSRLVVQPAELPVGLVTALLGGPFFMVLLLQVKERG